MLLQEVELAAQSSKSPSVIEGVPIPKQTYKTPVRNPVKAVRNQRDMSVYFVRVS